MRSSTELPVIRGDLKRWALIQADSIMLLRSFPTASVDAVVTDPPYGLGFNGEAWDAGSLIEPLGFRAFTADWAAEVKRVLKPGGHLVAFGSPRTFHRLVAGCEDIGLEIRDQLLWLHGRGVPKASRLPGGISTALKPAYEPILLARAPLARRTVAANIDAFGTAGLNVDACRVPRGELPSPDPTDDYWPSHLVLSHEADCGDVCAPDCIVPMLNASAGSDQPVSRWFYAAKTSSAEREAGLENLPLSREAFFSGPHQPKARSNIHPTVKPIELMQWLIRLTCPLGGIVLDPFTGSGTTGCAAALEGRQFLGIEKDQRFVPIASARLDYWTEQALRNRQQSVHIVDKAAHTKNDYLTHEEVK